MPLTGIARDRKRWSVKGLGTLEVAQIDPTPDIDFSDVGYLENTTMTDDVPVEQIHDETGSLINALPSSQTFSVDTNLQQVGIDEIGLLRNAADKLYAARYSGIAAPSRFQFYSLEQGRLYPAVNLQFIAGKRLLPLKIVSLYPDDTTVVRPVYYVLETQAQMRSKNLQLWVSPRHGYGENTPYILDSSGWGRYGTLTGYAVIGDIWKTAASPLRFLRFDGTNDQLDFGNLTALNDDALGDFVIEMWVRVQAANGTKEEILSKKALIDDNSAGFAIYRTLTSNLLSFRLGSGSASAVVSNATTTLQNVWKLFAVTVDRDGNATPYLNGVADGTPASVAAIGTGSNSLSLYAGRDGTNFGQVDVGEIRIYRSLTGTLPSDIATILANHFAGERNYYGV